ncbi:ribosomal protein L11 methyltransferase [Synechococcus sp. A18-25c]|uniref:50S ribosomal protein L11 methyltransferase n=1 Tax=unclassified Synechococcus TaxID=2626047 RepID=UPI0016485101|nr:MULTISPECIES: 50S ribosomal protein L11 methyltransferase [unclassified Synechococcus]MEC7897017.1 50S ribosomal protein L11 methyltransferase [Cyanobacteriota bacterium]MEC8095849.1 50S ribosomal protein L11 methyltransferase [Cyanobacteriota bacterium]QNI47506.1 ribosomal protein L11 methyltransferase [Synechococcus sp. A15-60]QNJ19125.1 ribosomal protein L11 methyltransferase [Synechococcus sp. A18-25c]|tara:strand:+ start:244 stop:1134 length:891 start_codon:yes stop_codon:yes gene_type:complete
MWWRLSLPIQPELEESLLWKLNELGLHRVAVQHAPETPDQCTLLAWLPAHEWPVDQRHELLGSLEPLAHTFGLALAAPRWDELADEDWSRSWKQHWQPDPVGRGMLILPAWLEVPEEHAGRLVLKMDPGSAFGTGSHPTTRLCLEALEATPPKGLRVADLGCGSGVLGLAALGLGARQVLAADTDSLAVRATNDNAAINALAPDALRVRQGSVEVLQELLSGEPADLLLCNILAPVIEALAPKFQGVLSAGGRGLLSGLLVEQAPRLTEVLEGLGWSVQPLAEQGRWGLLEIQRHA